MARALVPFGIMVVIPDYRNFPQTNVEGMIDDCDRAVEWTLQNIRTFVCLLFVRVVSFLGKAFFLTGCTCRLLAHGPFCFTDISMEH